MGTRALTDLTYNDQGDIEEKSERQKAIDAWLPITSSRNGKWWYSAFHIVTAMVEAGVLGLPCAMADLGWGPGVALLPSFWIITLYTSWLMVEMHEMVPRERFDRYHELAQHAFGEKFSLYIVVPLLLIVEVGGNIVSMVAGGKSLQMFCNMVCSSCKKIKTTYFVTTFAVVNSVLSQLPNFNSMAGVSLAAAVASLSSSTIAWAASLHKGVQPNVQYGYKAKSTAGIGFNLFRASGNFAFAYGGHHVMLEVQATIPSTTEKPSKGPIRIGLLIAYIFVALCYFPITFIGYWIFGNSVEDNVLISRENPAWLVAVANVFGVVHVIGNYQISAMPVFDMIETMLVKKFRFEPTRKLRFIARCIYVMLTAFVAITFPSFDDLLSFFGGLAFALTTCILPCMMWRAIKKPRTFSLSRWTNWIFAVIGGLLMVLAPIGALRQIIIHAKTYRFCS